MTVVLWACDVEPHWASVAASLDHNRDERIGWLIVDDGSADRTGDLAEAWAETTDGAAVLHLDRRCGPIAARNVGLDGVHTRFVTFLDAPDYCAPGRMIALLGALEELDVAFVRTDHVQVRGSRRQVVRTPERRHGVPFASRSGVGDGTREAMVDYVAVWAGAYDLHRLGGASTFDEAVGSEAAWPWVWALHLTDTRYGVVSAPAYYRSPRTTGSEASAAQSLLPASRAIVELVRERASGPALRHAVHAICHRVARDALAAAPDDEDARRTLAGDLETLLEELPDSEVRWVLARMATVRTAALRALGVELPDYGELR
ncbi:glycosyltransferase [Nostocoides sp. F2B08]|uniref:glycosyltransferase family 2 protein n=1 Tax=Nostocoides sp. F2B08 TaxID=2653936 RepID=UPI0012631B4B|nr:glycosyltransferase family 2 protein [Tetrasphaera sp. F2B08]KAB7741922.1 glycosyltransferase [Tetrasphaera sp. F2B08]